MSEKTFSGRGDRQGKRARYTLSEAAIEARRENNRRRTGRPRKGDEVKLEPKQRVLALLRSGRTPARASEITGVPKPTVYHWRRRWIADAQLDPEAPVELSVERGVGAPVAVAPPTLAELGIDEAEVRKTVLESLGDRSGADAVAARSLVDLHLALRREAAMLQREGISLVEPILDGDGKIVGQRIATNPRWTHVRQLCQLLGVTGADQEATPRSRTEASAGDVLREAIEMLSRFPRRAS